jgi:hypothetical protein
MDTINKTGTPTRGVAYLTTSFTDTERLVGLKPSVPMTIYARHSTERREKSY